MAILASTYQPPFGFGNGHLQTIVSSLFRGVSTKPYQRERLETADNDFLDLDWSLVDADDNSDAEKKSLVVLCHGLEGNTYRPYMLGMVKAFNEQGVDSLALNFRSCSGVTNRKIRFYHSGETSDLLHVIKHAEGKGYRTIFLVGFSLGGNVMLTFLGRESECVPNCVKRAVAFSVPCDLAGSSKQLSTLTNKIYMWRFIRDLRSKLEVKEKLFPELISLDGYDSVKTFEHFDNRYTAPIHGFDDAEDYWQKSSSAQFLDDIKVPTLLINAADDPFLSESCFPYEQANRSEYFNLEVPSSGGHVGFVNFNDNSYWSEQRALEFCLGE
jgi:predicted alpha/beta-fold hydrolase